AMSSTQHQLIEQCAIRLRGIVEALDNIHDTSPHRWSTDLDDVHSSAESLLALIKDQAPARSEASFEEWLANELEGEDGQPVPAAVCDIALARRAFNHWPKLEQPAKVGGVRFSAGVSSRLVVEAAQRLCEFESTPEKEAERIERLQAFREQLDPLNLTPHAEAFNEAPAEALRPEQAEAERPEVVGYLATAEHPKHGQPHKAFNYFKDQHDAQVAHWRERGCTVTEDRLMTVSQHERIVGALRSEIAEWQEAAGRSRSDVVAYIAERAKLLEERDAAQARVAGLEAELETERMRLAGCGTAALGYFDGCADAYKSASLSDVLRLRADCDSALARVAELESKLAELEKQEPIGWWAQYCETPMRRMVHWGAKGPECTSEEFHPFYAAPFVKAQHRMPGKYDEVLLPFLKSMEHELHANAGKGDRPGWLQMDRRIALLEIYYHLAKLQKATKDNDAAGIVEYAADVANMSMMLVDVCGLLAAAPAPGGE
ncbi:hypothetical protein L5B10_29765, partial [Pseudomonas aeruginosa]|nr:hypothetical protein [Pseudomonas aeruginosa]